MVFPPNGFEAVFVLPNRLVPVVVLLFPKRLPAGFCWLLPKRDVLPVWVFEFWPKPPNGLLAAWFVPPNGVEVFCVAVLLPNKEVPDPKPPVVPVFAVPKPVPVLDVCWVPKLNPGLFWVLLPKREVPVLVFDPKPPVLVLPNPVDPVEPKRPVPGAVCVWAPKRPPPVVAGLLPKRLPVFVDPNPEVVFWLF